MGYEEHFNVIGAIYSRDLEFWRSDKFDPLLNNARTGAKMDGNVHHCSRCRKAITRKCYTGGHQAFCLEWKDVAGMRVRCGQRFSIRSSGCGEHPSNSSLNGILRMAASRVQGQNIQLRDFEDPLAKGDAEEPEVDEREAIREENARILSEANEVMEKTLDGDVTFSEEELAELSFGAFKEKREEEKKKAEWEQKDKRKAKTDVKRKISDTLRGFLS